jgi:hypothetical protein
VLSINPAGCDLRSRAAPAARDVDDDPSRPSLYETVSIENDNDATTTGPLFGASFSADIARWSSTMSVASLMRPSSLSPVPLKQNGGERERTRRKDQDLRTGSMRLHRQPVATIFDDLGHCPKRNFVRIARLVKSRGNLSQADVGATTALRSSPGELCRRPPVRRFLDREVSRECASASPFTSRTT